jgi:hypothetical protein
LYANARYKLSKARRICGLVFSLPADVHDPEPPLQAGPDSPFPAEATGFLETSGEAVGDDGSVVPIIGGLPAAQGSAWNIGAPADERGAGLAAELGQREDREDEG